MSGPYDRLIEGRPTEADREWLSKLYGEQLGRIAPTPEEQFYKDLRASGGIFPDTEYGEFHQLKNALIAIAKLPPVAETKEAREIAMTALNWYRLEEVR